VLHHEASIERLSDQGFCSRLFSARMIEAWDRAARTCAVDLGGEHQGCLARSKAALACPCVPAGIARGTPRRAVTRLIQSGSISTASSGFVLDSLARCSTGPSYCQLVNTARSTCGRRGPAAADVRPPSTQIAGRESQARSVPMMPVVICATLSGLPRYGASYLLIACRIDLWQLRITAHLVAADKGMAEILLAWRFAVDDIETVIGPKVRAVLASLCDRAIVRPAVEPGRDGHGEVERRVFSPKSHEKRGNRALCERHAPPCPGECQDSWRGRCSRAGPWKNGGSKLAPDERCARSARRLKAGYLPNR